MHKQVLLLQVYKQVFSQTENQESKDKKKSKRIYHVEEVLQMKWYPHELVYTQDCFYVTFASCDMSHLCCRRFKKKV